MYRCTPVLKILILHHFLENTYIENLKLKIILSHPSHVPVQAVVSMCYAYKARGLSQHCRTLTVEQQIEFQRHELSNMVEKMPLQLCPFHIFIEGLETLTTPITTA